MYLLLFCFSGELLIWEHGEEGNRNFTSECHLTSVEDDRVKKNHHFATNLVIIDSGETNEWI